ncbi:MAG: tRNA pseudouridine(55) synthase TruB [Gammaproteobacteria bacterium HGW-Gammaproteobacteria-3]|nr:MAG: tRNA pseudouridine(55) synthase TruB [Gammaproteobacteria bacterium HGW-Gammaproteobacteria-3]
MAKRKTGCAIHGILLLDKRLGVSSNRALQEVRRLFNANKAGHTGSLDPLATGLLPLCFGEATKVSAFMLDDDKRYRVTVQLGVVTDTGDAEGRVLQVRSVPPLSTEIINACLKRFTGTIEQLPPMYSALKHEGKKLYELARQGKTVERKARRIRIYSIDLLDVLDACLELEVSCSKGTYIRTLAEDIGATLGCGATVTALRRLEAGRFSLDDAFTLEQLQVLSVDALKARLLAVDRPLQFMPEVKLSPKQAAAVKQGQRFRFDDSIRGMVRMYDGSRFLGLGELLLDGKLAPKKLFDLDDLPSPV